MTIAMRERAAPRSPDQADTCTGVSGGLPTWDLADLYPSESSSELESDRNWLTGECAGFRDAYAGRLASLSAEELFDCICRYDRIQSVSNRLASFAQLRHAEAVTDPDRTKFLSDMQSTLTDASGHLVFFMLELNRIEDSALEEMLSENAHLARYAPFLERVRTMRPYQLSDELEAFLHDRSVVGASAWSMLFDETVGALSFQVDGDSLSLEKTLHLLSDPDRSRREGGARELARVFGGNASLFARITNTLSKEKEILDRWRGLPTPQAGRHLANQVEPEVVDALRESVAAAYPDISHRYYRLKARWLGLEQLEIWDRNAPLPDDDDALVGWEDARDIVLGAYGAFSPDMARHADPFFRKGWIHAALQPGKSPGAFSHPTSSDVHPYILLNYQGRQRDVMVLAHELGHGVHQSLARAQGELLSDTPLTLAETASVFGEMLTFRSLLDRAGDPAARKVLLAGKIEDKINTVVRQIAFYDFERRIHEERRKGELVPEAINAIWMSVQAESLGPAFRFMDGYETFWSYVPHFVHAPFYVYAYAFGDCLVNSLYAVYEDSGPEFVPAYLDMLSAGGTKRHRELLAPFGLDAGETGFWEKGLAMISRLIDELEAYDS